MGKDLSVLRVLVVVIWAWGACAQFDFARFASPKVEIADGKLRGKHVLTREGRRVRAFLGVPYAKPPLGDLRFKSAEPVEPWEEERWALDHPKPCVQPEIRHGRPIGDEDCLYLNIYTPDIDIKRPSPMEQTKSVYKDITVTNEIKSTRQYFSTGHDDTFASDDPSENKIIIDPTLTNTIPVYYPEPAPEYADQDAWAYADQDFNYWDDDWTYGDETIDYGDETWGNENGWAYGDETLDYENGDWAYDDLEYGDDAWSYSDDDLYGAYTVSRQTAHTRPVRSDEFESEEETEPAECPLLPVIVFFHGGGFEMGKTEPFTHEYLLDHDIVLVTVQYRLGLLGFLSTGDEVLPGNLGLKDQRLALQWVQENIEHFGGCPNRVTVMGDGAGGASVHYHLLNYYRQPGLFRAGISMSGTALSPWAFRPPAEVSSMVDHLAQIADCPRPSQEFLDCLRNRSAEEFVNYLHMYKNQSHGGCGEWGLSIPVLGAVLESPDVEDAFLTFNPWEKKVALPWLVGVTSKEMIYEFTPQWVDRTDTLFEVTDACYNETLPRVLGYQWSQASDEGLIDAVRSFYLNHNPICREMFANVVESVSDASVVYPAFEAVRRAGRRSTWLYYFDYIGINTYGASALDGRIAPGRGDDLFFFFARPLGKNVPRRHRDADAELSSKLVQLWANFAADLEPTPEEIASLKWVPIHPSTTYLNIEQGQTRMERPFHSNRMNFWSLRPFPHREDRYENSTSEVAAKAKAGTAGPLISDDNLKFVEFKYANKIELTTTAAPAKKEIHAKAEQYMNRREHLSTRAPITVNHYDKTTEG